MEEFFSWNVLSTYTGAAFAVTVLTQFFKDISFIKRIPTRIFSYIVAVIILILATIFTTGFDVKTIGLCFINAAVISLASNGTFDMMTGKIKR